MGFFDRFKKRATEKAVDSAIDELLDKLVQNPNAVATTKIYTAIPVSRMAFWEPRIIERRTSQGTKTYDIHTVVFADKEKLRVVYIDPTPYHLGSVSRKGLLLNIEKVLDAFDRPFINGDAHT